MAKGSYSNPSEYRADGEVSRLVVQDIARAGRRTLILSGELDLATRPVFDETLQTILSESESALALDLSAIAFMDSTGLHALLSTKELCERRGRELLLVRPSNQVQRLLELSGLLDQVSIAS